tara:strand:+ start:142 stop:1047 length:906 start_codon:yes stop_codon:yes gene_type:complete
MVKYTLKKRNNKSKIKRKVKKSIKKTFKKSLKNRKKVFRKSINKKTKNYKKKKEGGFLGFGEGKTCIEVGTTNNMMGNRGTPFDYFGKRVYPFIKDQKDKKNYEHTVIDFIKTFLSDYPNSKSKLGRNPFTIRIDYLLTMHSVDAHADAYNISNNKNASIGFAYPLRENMLDGFSPYKYEGQRKSTETFKEEVESVRIRIFNLIMHEFDNMTCNVDDKTYRNKNNEEFAELSTTDEKAKSGETNIPKITSIKQFFEAFPTLNHHYKSMDENKLTGIQTKKYKYMNIIRVALNRRSSGIDFI